MRKLLAILMVVLCLSSSAMAQGTNSMFTRAISLSNRMNANTRNGAYLALLADDEEVINLVRAWGSKEHDLPAIVAQIREESGLIKMLVRESIATMGTEVLAATTMMETVTIFAGDDVGDGAYVMIYDNAVPVLVVWHSEDGAVRMRAMYLPFEGLAACKTQAEVSDWFEDNGIPLAATAVETMPVVSSTIAEGNMLERALSLAAGMDRQAADEAYGAFLGASDAMVALMQGWAAGDADAPVLAVRADMARGTPGFQLLNEVLVPQVEVDEPLLAKMVNAMPTILLDQYCDTETLAASSMIRGEALFAEHVHPMTGLFLFLYEDKAPIMVASYAKDGAVNMCAYYLPIEALSVCRTVEDVNGFFAADGLLPLTWETAE